MERNSDQQQQDATDEASKLEEWRRKREARRRQRREQERKDDWDTTDQRAHHEHDDEDETDKDSRILLASKRRRLEQAAVLAESLKQQNNRASSRRKQVWESIQQEEQGIKATDEQASESDRDGDHHDDDVQVQNQGEDGGDGEEVVEEKQQQPKLLTQAERLEKQRQDEENRLLREAATQISGNHALQTAKQIAVGAQYTTPMPSTWTIPAYIKELGPTAWQRVRQKYHIQHVQGTDIPPPLTRFSDMKLPIPIQELLHDKGITTPTPIQMQGLPVALAGRDLVGIAFTGSGKTLTFALPVVMAALEEEFRMPLTAGEGPVSIVMAPSRELARQTHQLVQELCDALANDKERRYPTLRCQLLIGGESIREQVSVAQRQGIHCVVATPGRLRDVLKRRWINFLIGRCIAIDEADRMLDTMGFDEEVGEIINYFPYQRQTLLFSATFPQKFQDFARQTLVQPIIVNVGRAGAANLDVIQEVEYVKNEAKIVYLLHCLQKTAPPVIIFCERKGHADDIHEYLLLKGVQAVSIHGGKDQEERNEAIALFKAGKKDVLIATDVAAKGLDFPSIQHVINFDMPSEIEHYVHRIGRTGRAGKTGVATTFINKDCDETTLLDLKAILKEAQQRIPPVLEMLDDPREQQQQQEQQGTGGGCSFCGGLGHTIVDCPKIDKSARRAASSRKDFLSGGGNW